MDQRSAVMEQDLSSGGYPLLFGMVAASLLVFAGIAAMTTGPATWMMVALAVLEIVLIVLGVLFAMRLMADEKLQVDDPALGVSADASPHARRDARGRSRARIMSFQPQHRRGPSIGS